MAQNQTPDSGGVSRRGLLKAGAIAAAVAPAASWRRSNPDRLLASGRAGLRRPGSLPDPRLPAGTDTIPQIEHIVVVMMENHSYDNHLGMLRRPGADGFRLGPPPPRRVTRGCPAQCLCCLIRLARGLSVLLR